MKPRIVPVILSGGAGSGLWPLSREHHTKQLISLLGEHTLLQATARRLAALDYQGDPIVVCSDEHRFMVRGQLGVVDMTPSAILVEPVARNTAPATAAAALEVLAQSNAGGDPMLLVLRGGHGFKIKHIMVNPDQRLSLQVHRHRAEHWNVVRGTARVTRGDETFEVSENQSTYIPRGVRHRLENPGTVPLELIELQSGSCLGEDDKIRFNDAYGRADRDCHQP